MDQAEKEEVQTEKGKQMDCESNDDEDDGDCEDDDEEEFTPSAWDANLAPHRSALRSPDKTLKSNVSKTTVPVFKYVCSNNSNVYIGIFTSFAAIG